MKCVGCSASHRTREGEWGRRIPPALIPMLLLVLLAFPAWRCSLFEREGELSFVPLVCRSPHVVTSRERVHYPEDDCRAAVRKAESRLTSGHYRRACQQMSPAAGLPAKVVEVRVTACTDAARLPGVEGGSVLSVDICCP